MTIMVSTEDFLALCGEFQAMEGRLVFFTFPKLVFGRPKGFSRSAEISAH